MYDIRQLVKVTPLIVSCAISLLSVTCVTPARVTTLASTLVLSIFSVPRAVPRTPNLYVFTSPVSAPVLHCYCLVLCLSTVALSTVNCKKSEHLSYNLKMVCACQYELLTIYVNFNRKVKFKFIRHN